MLHPQSLVLTDFDDVLLKQTDTTSVTKLDNIEHWEKFLLPINSFLKEFKRVSV